MRDWHSMQYETQHRMMTRTHDAALGHQASGSSRLALRRMWRGLVAGFERLNARRRMLDRSTRGYEGGGA